MCQESRVTKIERRRGFALLMQFITTAMEPSASLVQMLNECTSAICSTFLEQEDYSHAAVLMLVVNLRHFSTVLSLSLC